MTVADSDLIKAATDFESEEQEVVFSETNRCESTCDEQNVCSVDVNSPVVCLFVQVVMRPEQTVEEGQQVGLSLYVKPTRKVFCLYPKC